MGISTWGLSWKHPIIFQNPAASTPDNGYVTEDESTFYVAEDGVTFYVQEN